MSVLSWLSPQIVQKVSIFVLLTARHIWWLVLQVVVKLFKRDILRYKDKIIERGEEIKKM